MARIVPACAEQVESSTKNGGNCHQLQNSRDVNSLGLRVSLKTRMNVLRLLFMQSLSVIRVLNLGYSDHNRIPVLASHWHQSDSSNGRDVNISNVDM